MGAVAALWLVAGCSVDGGGEKSVERTGGGGAATGAGLFAVNSQALGGPIVIDVQGYVLYRSDADGSSPSRSGCVRECARTWRPMPAGDIGRLRIVGMDRGKVGTFVRPDGSRQLTLAGWPLYSYMGDLMPGDTNGHGRDGWFVISPAGARAGRSSS